MITLNLLRILMTEKGLSPQSVSRLVPPDLSVDRISELCSKNDLRRPEPWLWEAFAISTALGLNDICTMIGMPMEHIQTDEELQDDIDIWNTGVELPLRLGISIARRLGMSDPYDLYLLIQLRRRNPLMMEAWSITASGERSGALVCPWCREPVGSDHLDTCLPNNLWGERQLSTDEIMRGASAPEPYKPGRRQHGKGTRAPGLKATRQRLRNDNRPYMTQAWLAERLGVSYAHYSKIEACKAAFTPELAIKLRNLFPDVTNVELFTAPTVVKAASVEGAPPPIVEVVQPA